MYIEQWHSDPEGVPEGLDELVAAAREVDHHKPLDEHALVELKAGPQEMPHAAFVARNDEGALLGYAHVSKRETLNGWRFEFVTHPAHRGRGVATLLVTHVFQHVAADGGGTLHTWSPDDNDPARARLIERFELRQIRRLHQMHAPVPVPPVSLPEGISVRGFTEADAQRWLELHNTVFAGHPDASGWRDVDLRWRMGEPWFDPEGFRLAFRGDELVAYNWVKIHDHDGAAHHEDDPDTRIVGEIYMLGVGAAGRGIGLGAAIASEGLRWAEERGSQRAMLYVDESNRPARKVYEDLGFTTSHVDVSYAVTIPAALDG